MMSVFPVADQSVLPVVPLRVSPLTLGAVGSVVSTVGPVVIFAGSLNNNWWSVPVIIGIFLCGVVGLFCGRLVHSSSTSMNGSLSGTERLLAAASLLIGGMAVSIVLLVMAVLGLMMFLSR